MKNSCLILTATTFLICQCAIAGYEAVVQNLTPFQIKIRALALGPDQKKQTIVAAFATGRSTTPAANLLQGVEIEINIPKPGTFEMETKKYEVKWSNQAKHQDVVVFTVPKIDFKNDYRGGQKAVVKSLDIWTVVAEKPAEDQKIELQIDSTK